VFPMRYELDFYIPEYDIFLNHRRENVEIVRPLGVLY
jgi:hypothetical protein